MDLEKINYQKLNNREILEKYLERVRNKSYKTANAHKSILVQCLNYLEKPVLKITKSDIIDFISNEINTKVKKNGKNKGKSISIESKKQYCRNVKSFFDDIEYRSTDKSYRSPVPSVKSIKLSGIGKKMKKISDRDDNSFSKAEIEEILTSSKNKNFRDFIFFTILVVTGMRVSECLSIRVKNVHLKERFIETGFENGAQKSKQALIFFYPKSFSVYLEQYILWTRQNAIWLFQGSNKQKKSEEESEEKHLTDSAMRVRIKKKYGHKWQEFHRFRRTIITHRIDLNCPSHISEILTNHMPSSLQHKHYYSKLSKKNIPELAQWYDKWFPYYDLIYF